MSSWKKREYNLVQFFNSQTHLETRVRMIDVEDLYFSFSKKLLLVVGLWPYQQSMIVQFQNIVIFCILVTGVIFHVCTII